MRELHETRAALRVNDETGRPSGARRRILVHWCSWVLAATALALSAAPAKAQLTLRGGTTLVFAGVEEAKSILTRPDDFVRRMSPFDRAARMKTDKHVSEAEYLEFVGKNVLAWDDTGKEAVTSAFHAIQAELEALSLPFPKQIHLVTTTGHEEGGADYTRGHAIVIAKGHLTAPSARLQKIIAHELFHILSRNNPDLRDELYAAIGFVKCNELSFPAELLPRKITNPDAPINEHCVRLQANGAECWAIPILFSKAEKYDPARGGEFFEYLQFQFLLVERDERTGNVKPLYAGASARLAGMLQISGFHELVGRNTGYIIHPEEILADNFALLVLRAEQLPSPEVVEKLRAILNK